MGSIIGIWKLNIEKSKHTPERFPLKSLTIVRETADGAGKVTLTGELVNVTPINTGYTAKYDGTEASVTGSGAPYDTISIKQVDADTFTDEPKKTGGQCQRPHRDLERR